MKFGILALCLLLFSAFIGCGNNEVKVEVTVRETQSDTLHWIYLWGTVRKGWSFEITTINDTGFYVRYLDSIPAIKERFRIDCQKEVYEVEARRKREKELDKKYNN